MTEAIEAYPLHWPQGKPRTKYPERSRFDVGAAVARDYLFSELDMLGGKNIIVSTNIRLRNDGLPYASQKEPDERGVAVYFDYKGNQVCFCCDRWDLVKDNMQAIRHTINALRGISRWGTGDMVEAAFRGFQALPAPTQAARPWFMVLGVPDNASIDICESEYRKKAKSAHPDKGGNVEDMSTLNDAIKIARERQ